MVAQADGLLDTLHADAVLRETRDREGAGDGAERDHQVVEGQFVGLAHQRLDDRDLAVLVDGGDPAGEDLRLGEHAAQRHHDVAGEMLPAAVSGRKGWYVMYERGSTTVTVASA